MENILRNSSIKNDRQPRVIYLGGTAGFFSREILRGVLTMRQAGCDWDFWALPDAITKEELIGCLENRRVDGVIARGLSEDTARALIEHGVATVFIRSAEDAGAEYINGPHADDNKIGELAGEEFSRLHLGYWGFVHWEGVMWSEARKRVFHSYATARAVSNDTLALKESERKNWTAVERIGEWLKRLPKPCGVLACNDEAGLDVVHACEQQGFDVPGDVAIIGVDNDRLICESGSVALSSIDLKPADTGRAAVIQLGKMLGILDEDVRAPVTVAQCIQRESCDKIDRNKLIYQKALDYIHSRSLRNVKVDELARACGISRRGMERAFEGCGVASPAALIRDIRLVAIIKLLEDRNSSIESVAEQSGFSDAGGLSNFVKRMTGNSPSFYR